MVGFILKMDYSRKISVLKIEFKEKLSEISPYYIIHEVVNTDQSLWVSNKTFSNYALSSIYDRTCFMDTKYIILRIYLVYNCKIVTFGV